MFVGVSIGLFAASVFRFYAAPQKNSQPVIVVYLTADGEVKTFSTVDANTLTPIVIQLPPIHNEAPDSQKGA